ncbi:hypothetical protein [Succinivibrio dextrinosolvens]|nr:hypothetical protein [Succinivibrio dextrinosolvens]
MKILVLKILHPLQPHQKELLLLKKSQVLLMTKMAFEHLISHQQLKI